MNKILTNVFWFVTTCMLLILLNSCSDNDSDTNSSNTLFASGLSYSNNYLFYSSAGAIYAVDPLSPDASIPIEPEEANATAPVLLYDYYTQNVGARSLLYPALVYAKEGNIWAVNAFGNSALKRAQLSNENQAHHVCKARSRRNGQSNLVFDIDYHYTLAGDDDACFYNVSPDLPNVIDDNVEKLANLRMSANDSPEPFDSADLVYFPTIPDSLVTLVEYSSIDESYNILGQLVLDDSTQTLLWYDELRSPASKIIIAESVSTVRTFINYATGIVFLDINQQLHLFDGKSKQLSDVLFNFEIDDPYSSVWSDPANRDNLLIISSKGVYRMPLNASSMPESVYLFSPDVISYRYYGATTNTYLLSETDATEKIIYTITKDGLNYSELYRTAGDINRFIDVSVNSTRVFIEDTSAKLLKIASEDGQFTKVLENHVIIDFLTPSTTDSNYERYSWILAGKYISNAELALVTLDSDGVSLVELGIVSNYSSEAISQHLLLSADNTLLILPIDNNDEIYFANLREASSLARITDNDIDDEIIDTSWRE